MRCTHAYGPTAIAAKFAGASPAPVDGGNESALHLGAAVALLVVVFRVRPRHPPPKNRSRIITATATSPTSLSSRVARALGAAYLRLLGWKVEGVRPATPRAVLIAAPHTSNWDLPFMLAMAWVLGLRPSWLGKAELFRWPFGMLMHRLGGISIDRTERQNFVERAVGEFATRQELILVVPPSGTRSRAPHWKSGFYHIARLAGVPIVCTYLDYGRKRGGIGPVVTPSGDVRADMRRIRAVYTDVSGKYPALTTPVRLREEDDESAA
jgi:1-acyl-sn-glycerol-3-phosphate acyltransferase